MPDMDVVDVIFKMNREIGEMNTTLKKLHEDQKNASERIIKNHARFHSRLSSLEKTRTWGMGFVAAFGFVGSGLWQAASQLFKGH